MKYLDEIKNTSFDIIKDIYHDYLKENKILLIKNENIDNVITEYYNSNLKNIQQKIRNNLKENHKNDYDSLQVENMLLDLNQEKDLYIKNIISEIKFIQDSNILNIKIPIINNSLNLNIDITDYYVLINSVNVNNVENYNEIYDELNKYKFLYSIENNILENYNRSEKLELIKNLKANKEEINICVYYFKKNC